MQSKNYIEKEEEINPALYNNESISSFPWSETQIYQLNHQIYAYKHLIKNQKVPQHILDKIDLLKP